MALRAPSRLLAVAICAAIVVTACTSDRAPAGPIVLGESQHDTHDHGKTAKVVQDLSSSQFFGTSLPAKTLALTFDDGPGPRTKELSAYLKSQNIRAAFFMNGARLAASALPNPNGITLVADPAGTLAQVLADGHLVANHTTTHRNLTNEVPDAQRVQELSDTDTDIAGFISPQNHLLFRAPYGAYNAAVYNTLSASAMNKYIGPIYWEAGGFSDEYPTAAADWACWQGSLYSGASKVNIVPGNPGYATTTQCGDAYLTEINAFGKGIVLMHDPYSWAQGSTVDMVKYLIPKLVAAGYAFARVDEVPTIAAALPPPCDPSCATCSGPGASHCTSCASGKYVSGGQCVTCSTCSASEYQVTACTTTNENTACGGCSAACGTCTGPSASECSTCTANKYLNGGACAACSVCGPGTYESAACTPTADRTCGACHASCAACSGPNANQCASCPASFFVSGGACHACTVCDAGTFQASACTTTADSTCAACRAGSFTKVAGSTTCTPCPAGEVAAAAGAATCSACPAGTSSGPGSGGCTACGSCEDGNACTHDRCDAAKGCVHEPILGCETSAGTLGLLIDGGTDAESGSVVVNEDSGCSVAGRPERSGSGRDGRGLLAVAALGMSLLVRRRRQPSP